MRKCLQDAISVARRKKIIDTWMRANNATKKCNILSLQVEEAISVESLEAIKSAHALILYINDELKVVSSKCSQVILDRIVSAHKWSANKKVAKKSLSNNLSSSLLNSTHNFLLVKWVLEPAA